MVYLLQDTERHTMNRINLICLGVENINTSLDFYKSLGFNTLAKVNTGIVFFDNQGSKLELFQIDELAKDINLVNPPSFCENCFSGITLACNMKSKQEVDDLFNLVNQIGGTIVKSPETVSWGGYSGYFQNPDVYY